MLIQEISNEPLFKDYIRRLYERHAVINILPTDRGKREIDENHIYYVCKIKMNILFNYYYYDDYY